MTTLQSVTVPCNTRTTKMKIISGVMLVALASAISAEVSISTDEVSVTRTYCLRFPKLHLTCDDKIIGYIIIGLPNYIVMSITGDVQLQVSK